MALSHRSGRLAGRAVWVIADQALSSLSNAALALVIATQVTTTEYGAFALAFSLYGFAVASTQSVAGQVLSVKFARADGPAHAAAGSSATGVALGVAVLGGLVLALTTAFLGGPIQTVLVVLAVLLPGLLVQDTWRSVFISRGTPAAAFANDAVWLVLQAAFIAVPIVLHRDSASWYVLAWGAAATLAALYGRHQAGYWPHVAALRSWFTTHREVVVPSFAGSFAVLGAAQVAYIAIAAIGTLADVGALRATQTLLGPVNILSFAASAFLIPEVARRGVSARVLTQVAVGSSVVLAGVTAAWGAVFLLLPASAGRFLLGDTWASAREVLPWMLVFSCCIALTSGATSMMRAWNRGSHAFWVSAALGPMVLALSAFGAHADGAVGAAVGFAVAAGSSIPLAWFLFARVAARGPVAEAA